MRGEERQNEQHWKMRVILTVEITDDVVEALFPYLFYDLFDGF